MGVSRYNSEGYYDPTAYEALTKVTQEEKAARYRPLVYICSPYSGDTEGNTEKARRYSRFAADASTIPIAPHLLFPQFLSEETEREDVYKRQKHMIEAIRMSAFGSILHSIECFTF